MSDASSITKWLHRVQAGERSEAVDRLWAAYFSRMVRLAQHRLGQRPRSAEGDDVAVAAFDSFLRGTTAGRFPRLHNRDDLWRVLFTLTVRKAADVIAAEQRLKRGGGTVHSLDRDVPTSEPTPDEAAMIAENVERLLSLLPTDELRRVAIAKLEGYTNAEIAVQIQRSEVTVERKLHLIRKLWQESETERAR